MAKTKDPVPSEQEVVDQKNKMERAEQEYVEERSKFREMVARHLDGGGSPTKLGRAFDPPVTRGRIHQYRTAWLKEQESA